MTKRFTRTSKALGWLNAVGELVLLQLCFAILSLGVVTVFPAAVALQRGLHDVLYEAENTSILVFGRRFAAAFRQYWRLTILVPLIAIMLGVSILFWLSADAPVGIAAVAFLVPLAGVLIGFYLCVLAVAVSLPEEPEKRVIALAWRRLPTQPLQLAGCIVVMLTWALLLAKLPTLGLVGSGILPAVLVVWLCRPTAQAISTTRTTGD